MTARLWSPEAPKDWVNVTFLPAVVAWNALIRLAYAACGVEYATIASCAAGSDWSFLACDADAPAAPTELTVSTLAIAIAPTAVAQKRPVLISPPNIVDQRD